MTPVAATALGVRDLTVVRGGRPVLRRVDLTVRTGELVTVLGGNGSGKSTLVRAALGLVPTASGRVELLGTALPRFREWVRIGYVPQRSTAASGVPATVREVVAAGRLARRRLLRPLGRSDRKAVDAALEAVDLTERRADPVAELSGGQQQRVLIARSLVSDPDLLVLDEPTAGVDLSHQAGLSDLLAERTARGVAVVLVAHELGPLARLVDRVVVLVDGRVAFDGTPDEEAAAFGHDHVHHHVPYDWSPGFPATGVPR